MPDITIEFSLPWAPSMNRIWRAGRGRVYRSAEYIAWLNEAQIQWLLQRPKLMHRKITGEYKILIDFFPPDKRRRDMGNLEKVVSDFCQAAGIIEDDSLCRDIHLVWKEQRSSGSVDVKLSSIRD